MTPRTSGRLIDISTPMDANLAGWPDDTPFRFDLAWRQSDGASVNVGRVTTSIHTGTHVDAPFHFSSAGRTVDQLGLAPFIGPARVIDVRGLDRIEVDHLAGLDLTPTPRILFRTDAWLDRSHFPESIPTLHPAVPEFLRERGVILAGFDIPSVDAIASKTLPIHHALELAKILILEGLILTGVDSGVYELIALPLFWVGADGAPTRAILRTWDEYPV